MTNPKIYSSYTELELLILRWAEARQIVPVSTAAAQARKTLEEAGELLEAAAEMRSYKAAGADELYGKAREAYKDAVGDVLVTLIIGAALADVPIIECLSHAYEQIKDRKGTLRADGVFVKESS